jgi:hypothetical protein
MAAVALEVSAIGARSLGCALAVPHCERLGLVGCTRDVVCR